HQKVTKEELDYIRDRDLDQKQLKQSQPQQTFAQDFRFWIVWFGMLVASFLFFGLSIWLPTYLIQGKNFSEQMMTSVTSLSWLFALGFVFICAYLSDKTRRPSLLATIMFALCTIFLTITYLTSIPLLAGI